MQHLSYKKATFLLILFSTILRLFLGNQLEFGNDEVYYWLYAKYPDISHFDHPAMVGLFIQFFSFNLFFDSELAIRLASILTASVNMYVVFLIGKHLKNEKTGFIASILYNLSIYGLIISGTFILPDAPLVFFWLLSFYFLIQVLPKHPKEAKKWKLTIAYFFIGCAIYSKYQAIYLLGGLGLYILLFNRNWLKQWQLYFGLIFPLLAIALIYYWNYQNNFISYKFHEERVSFFSLNFNHVSFLREILGQFAYNNPYIFILVILSITAFLKNKFKLDKKIVWLFLCFTLPLILTTIYLSFSRNTLPHWSGVSYLTLLPLLAVYVSEKKNIHKNLIKGFSTLSVILILASFSINNGWFLPKPASVEKEKLSSKDAIMDMYGWKQTNEKLSRIFSEKKLTDLPIISNRWYPASHIDYYIARPNKMKVYGVGSLTDIHKYYWINETLKKLKNEVLYITNSRNFEDPNLIYNNDYKSIIKLATIPVKRGNTIVKYVFLYKLVKN